MQQQNIEFLLVFTKTNFKELHLVGVLSFFLKKIFILFRLILDSTRAVTAAENPP